jgi:hypothetical protein
MLFRKDQKSSTGTENLKGSEEIATTSASDTEPDVEKKSFLDMTTLIRSIQRAEGNTDCFKSKYYLIKNFSKGQLC